MRIALYCLLLNGALAAQTAPSLTPMLPLPDNPPVPQPAQSVRAEPVAPAQPPKRAEPAAPTQWSAAYGGSTDFATSIARDQPGWERLWHSVKRDPPQALKPATEMGVMVHLGQRPTGGYNMRVRRAYAEDAHFVIEFTEYAPGPDSMVTEAITQPWVIALVPNSELPVVFKKAGPGRQRTP